MNNDNETAKALIYLADKLTFGDATMNGRGAMEETSEYIGTSLDGIASGLNNIAEAILHLAATIDAIDTVNSAN